MLDCVNVAVACFCVVPSVCRVVFGLSAARVILARRSVLCSDLGVTGAAMCAALTRRVVVAGFSVFCVCCVVRVLCLFGVLVVCC